MTRSCDMKQEKLLGYANQEEANDFDIVLPQQTTKLTSRPHKVLCFTEHGTRHILSLKNPNQYHSAIFTACSAAFESDWFLNSISERSKPTYWDCTRLFLTWLNETNYVTKDNNRYDCLIDYELYYMNQKGCKTSPLSVLKIIIENGLDSPFLEQREIKYLERLLNLTDPAPTTNRTSFTLTDWLSLPWLRNIIEEKDYLRLESAARVHSSFRITVAVTLIFLLEIRSLKQAQPSINFDNSEEGWQYNWNYLQVQKYGSFDNNGSPLDAITELVWLDLVKPSFYKAIKDKISKEGIHSLRKKIEKDSNPPWQKPNFFHPDYQEIYSPIEELLASWLFACEAIQTSDIPKLKPKDYAVENNSSGSLIMMQCQYYKGRSGDMQSPQVLMASNSWTRAIYLYMQKLDPSKPMFRSNVKRQISIPNLGSRSKQQTLTNFLFNIWKIPVLRQRINSELHKEESTQIFLNAFLALENGSLSKGNYCRANNKSSEEYYNSVPRPLPPNLFTLTHIKNTSVHAGGDDYRDSDLINHHSHTSATEKHSYLTDQNKDFVNRSGRITRLVLHDLQNTVYQPSIDRVQSKIKDLELRTKIIDATSIEDTNVQNITQLIDKDEFDDQIVVYDTLDSALFFMHYINQAEIIYPSLLRTRPDFVERTLIVKVEWMTQTLSKMRSAKEAKKQYKTLQQYLPPLFDHLLESTE